MSRDTRTERSPTVPLVALADEFGLSMVEMLSLCARLGCELDESDAIDQTAAEHIREFVAVHGPHAALGKRPRGGGPAVVRPATALPELGSVWQEGVRRRTALAIALIIISIASVVGVLVDRFVGGDHSNGAPPPVAVLDPFGGAR